MKCYDPAMAKERQQTPFNRHFISNHPEIATRYPIFTFLLHENMSKYPHVQLIAPTGFLF